MDSRLELARQWPQFALSIDVDGVHLEAPTDDQVASLANRASHPDAVLPASEAHFVKWLEGRSQAEIEQQRKLRVQSNRDLHVQSGWTIDLAVIVGDEPVGLQSLSGLEGWSERRIVGTTSWLLAPFQRRGIGTRSRAAVLELAFAHLGARSARTWVLEENAASIAVSNRLGYQQVGKDAVEENGRQLVELIYQVGDTEWLDSDVRRRYAPRVVGAEPLARHLCG